MSRITVQEFVKQYKKEAPFELVEGEVKPIKLMVAGHATVLKNLYDPLSQFVKEHDLGEVFYHLPYVILDQDGLVRNARVPDLMFIRKERFIQYEMDRPNWKDAPLMIIPDMAVQVQTRYEDFYETDEIVKRYLHDGIEEVWWVRQDVMVVFIEHQSNSVLLRLDDNLVSDDFPGFSISIKQIFKELLEGRENLRQRVVKQIEEAFADTPFPHKTGIYGYSIDYDLQGKHWQEVSLDIIFRQRGELSLITFEAFRFYLPAFMRAALLHYDELDTLPGNLISHLSPELPESSFYDYALRKHSHFNRVEQTGILAFLEALRSLYPAEYSDVELVFGPMLDSAIEYWKKRLIANQ